MSPRGRNPKSILVTGCDSGIGLEVVKSLANQAQGQQNIAVILAAAKNPNNSELNHLAKNNGKVKTLQLDLDDQKNFGNFANEVQRRLNEAGVQHLSALVNAAALHFNSSLNNVDAGQMIKAFSVNAVSPLMLIKALAKQLQSGGDSSGNAGVGAGGMLYSSSKASNTLNEGANVNLNSGLCGPSDAISAAHNNQMCCNPMHGNNLGNNLINNLRANTNNGANFGIGGANSGAILVGQSGEAFSGNGGSGVIVNLTSGLSSIGASNGGQFYAYRASKSALNMITKSVAADLSSTGVLVFSLNIDNAALDSNAMNATANSNSAQGFNSDNVAQAINNLINNGNANINGSLINVQGVPLLF